MFYVNPIAGISDRLAYYEEKARLLLRVGEAKEKYSKPPVARTYYVTAEERETIFRLHKQGANVTEIENQTGRRRGTIHRILQGRSRQKNNRK